eukprot:TRINITY_DN9009_c0_g1_i1.p1 TRINITY_DN9009_c0_g1~~TRINITY_DN9009_c0_g1_i1.p1  ORF type:complete len:277 (-),score=57.91 TRINITY_DN9009_c0_g1_i1:379-1209(-)
MNPNNTMSSSLPLILRPRRRQIKIASVDLASPPKSPTLPPLPPPQEQPIVDDDQVKLDHSETSETNLLDCPKTPTALNHDTGSISSDWNPIHANSQTSSESSKVFQHLELLASQVDYVSQTDQSIHSTPTSKKSKRGSETSEHQKDGKRTPLSKRRNTSSSGGLDLLLQSTMDVNPVSQVAEALSPSMSRIATSNIDRINLKSSFMEDEWSKVVEGTRSLWSKSSEQQSLISMHGSGDMIVLNREIAQRMLQSLESQRAIANVMMETACRALSKIK